MAPRKKLEEEEFPRIHLVLSKDSLEKLDNLSSLSHLRSRSRTVEELISTMIDLGDIFYDLRKNLKKIRNVENVTERGFLLTSLVGMYMKTMQIPFRRVGLLHLLPEEEE